jgi:hypothetical protein
MTAMRDISSLSPADYTDCTWPEAELARFNTYMVSKEPLWDPSDPPDRLLAPDVRPQPPDPPAAGHNSDPGPDQTFSIALPIPEWVPHARVRKFVRALQEQGDHKHRFAALDQAAYRARADRRISAAAYRVYEVVRAKSKDRHRCCLSDLDKIGYLAAGDRARASKLLTELEDNNVTAILRFTEGRLGAPNARKLIIAPVVTAEDRMEASSARIETEADAAKVEALRKRAEAAKKAYRREAQVGLVVTEETRVLDQEVCVSRKSSFTPRVFLGRTRS